MRALRFIIGLLLLPGCAAASLALLRMVREIPSESAWIVPAPALALAAGFALWLVLFALLPAGARSYILAHELTHALWGIAFGARVGRLRVSGNGGSVTLSKTNFLITLAPYFFPLYAVIVVAAYFAASLFFDMRPWHLLWLGLTGFTWGLHFTFTLASLREHQTDIQLCGHLFSYAVIFILNVAGIALWIVMVSDLTIAQFACCWGREMFLAYLGAWKLGVSLYNKKSG